MTTTTQPTPEPAADSAAVRKVASWSLPITVFSVPLGLAGLGGSWVAASQLLGASEVPAGVA